MQAQSTLHDMGPAQKEDVGKMGEFYPLVSHKSAVTAYRHFSPEQW
jgi:hypothetical protein